jgi:hypothetical protein
MIVVAALAEHAAAEVRRHPPRSPQRRAACHLWAACILPGGKTQAAIRRAVESFGTSQAQADALDLLSKIIRQETPA